MQRFRIREKARLGERKFKLKNSAYMNEYRLKKKREAAAAAAAEAPPPPPDQFGAGGPTIEVPDLDVDDGECITIDKEQTCDYMVFRHPFSMTVCGTSGSGKTFWVIKLLKHKDLMIQPNVDKITWFYGSAGSMQEVREKGLGDIEFIKGLPTDTWISQQSRDVKKLVIIDDQMSKLNTGIVGDMFTKHAHHENMSVILLLQNLFPQNARDMRDINLNAKYRILFEQPDLRQMRILSSSLLDQPNAIQDILAEKKKKKDYYAYLVIDHNQTTPKELRLRSNVFPGEEQEVYLIGDQ